MTKTFFLIRKMNETESGDKKSTLQATNTLTQ